MRYRVIYFQCLCYLALPLCIVSMHLTRCVLWPVVCFFFLCFFRISCFRSWHLCVPRRACERGMSGAGRKSSERVRSGERASQNTAERQRERQGGGIKIDIAYERWTDTLPLSHMLWSHGHGVCSESDDRKRPKSRFSTFWSRYSATRLSPSPAFGSRDGLAS